MVDFESIRDAKNCFFKILNELKDLEQYREETGLVDGIADIDRIGSLASKGYFKLGRVLKDSDRCGALTARCGALTAQEVEMEDE